MKHLVVILARLQTRYLHHIAADTPKEGPQQCCGAFQPTAIKLAEPIYSRFTDPHGFDGCGAPARTRNTGSCGLVPGVSFALKNSFKLSRLSPEQFLDVKNLI